MVYQSINGLAPIYITEIISRLSDKYKKELRSTETDVKIPLRMSACGQKCFYYKSGTM